MLPLAAKCARLLMALTMKSRLALPMSIPRNLRSPHAPVATPAANSAGRWRTITLTGSDRPILAGPVGQLKRPVKIGLISLDPGRPVVPFDINRADLHAGVLGILGPVGIGHLLHPHPVGGHLAGLPDLQ